MTNPARQDAAIGAMIVARKHGKKTPQPEGRQDAVGAASTTSQAASSTPMTAKDYEREMRRLHGELVAMQEWVKTTGAKDLHRLRGQGYGRQGRHHQADHGARQPSCLQGRGAVRSDRAREVADVHPALPGPFPGRWGGRDLRPKLVQPCRRRAGHGLLHARAGGPVPRAGAGRREGHGRLRHDPAQVLAGGQRRGADPPPRGSHPRPAEDLEADRHGPEVVRPLGRLFSRPRCHVRGHGHPVGTLVPRPDGRQEARTAQHHQPSPELRFRTIRSSFETSRCPKRSGPAKYVGPDLPLRFIPTPF